MLSAFIVLHGHDAPDVVCGKPGPGASIHDERPELLTELSEATAHKVPNRCVRCD